MVNLNKSLIQAAKESSRKKREQKKSETPAPPSILGRRMEVSKELNKGERVKKLQYKVNPASCRLWECHNRSYELLNEVRCTDLIEGFKSMGKQEFAAIVRRVENDPKHNYEIICGARRHWTATYLGWDLLVEVRDLSDEEAFRLADIENRDREDISDFERASDYRNALNTFYSSQKQMAERLEVSVDWLSRFLALADLPDEIVKAYRDVTEIRVQHGRDLAKGLKDAKARRRILTKAKELHGKGFDGQQVITHLKKAVTTAKAAKGALAQYKGKNGKPALTVNKKGRDGLTLVVEPGCGASKDEVNKMLKKALEEHFS